MIDKIILGFIIKRELTTYDIKIAMEKSISQFYSNSFGSINPAIKKLEKRGCIVCSESKENHRNKKFYKITDKGQLEYNEWISQPLPIGRIKDEVLVRIFFLGDTDKQTQKTVIKEYLNELKTTRNNLEVLKSKIHSTSLSAEKINKIKFQLSTLQFGMDYVDFKQQWFEKLLMEI